MGSREPNTGEVDVVHRETATRVVLSGDLDARSAPQLRLALEEIAFAGRPVEVDAALVTFISSTALDFLARVNTQTGRRVRLIGPPEQMRFLLELTGLADIVDIIDTPDAVDVDMVDMVDIVEDPDRSREAAAAAVAAPDTLCP